MSTLPRAPVPREPRKLSSAKEPCQSHERTWTAPLHTSSTRVCGVRTCLGSSPICFHCLSSGNTSGFPNTETVCQTERDFLSRPSQGKLRASTCPSPGLLALPAGCTRSSRSHPKVSVLVYMIFHGDKKQNTLFYLKRNPIVSKSKHV